MRHFQEKEDLETCYFFLTLKAVDPCGAKRQSMPCSMATHKEVRQS